MKFQMMYVDILRLCLNDQQNPIYSASSSSTVNRGLSSVSSPSFASTDEHEWTLIDQGTGRRYFSTAAVCGIIFTRTGPRRHAFPTVTLHLQLTLYRCESDPRAHISKAELPLESAQTVKSLDNLYI